MLVEMNVRSSETGLEGSFWRLLSWRFNPEAADDCRRGFGPCAIASKDLVSSFTEGAVGIVKIDVLLKIL